MHRMAIVHLTTARRGWLALFLVALTYVAMGAGADAPAPAGIRWVVFPSTQKVFPDTVPAGQVEARLTAAVNEYVSFQIALRAERATTLRVSTDLAEAALFEALVIATPGVAAWGYPEEFSEHRRAAYPDPLVPVERIALTAGATKSLWVRIKARKPATGHVRVGVDRVPVALDTLPFAMPSSPTLATAIGLGGLGFARYYGVPPYSDDYWNLYEKYYDALLEYRLTGSRVPRGWDDPRARNRLKDPRVTTFIAEYSNHRETMREMWAKFEELGVRHKAWFYNLDEPESVEEYRVARDQVEYLRDVCPGYRYGLPFFTGAPDKSTPFDHLSGRVNLWIIQTDYYSHGHGLGDKVREQARGRREAGDEIWVYTALAPRGGWCNILLNHTALEHRLLFWQIYAEETPSGYLFWHATHWDQTADPWTDQATVKRLDPHLWGDGSLFYPGREGPVGSIRLELIRAGLQDYELMKLAEAKVGRERVMRHVGRVTTNFRTVTSDAALVENVRRELQRTVVGK
jgi:hypothetical protein